MNLSVLQALEIARNAVNKYFEEVVNIEEDDEEEFERFFQSIGLSISKEKEKLLVSFVPETIDTAGPIFSIEQLTHISKAIEAAQAAIDGVEKCLPGNDEKTRQIRYVFLLSNLLPVTLDFPCNVHPSSQALQMMREMASEKAVEELEKLVNSHSNTVRLTLAHEEFSEYRETASSKIDSMRFPCL